MALRSILPPNLLSGDGGSCFPLMVVVALGEPGVPVVSWARRAGETATRMDATTVINVAALECFIAVVA